VRCSSPSVQQSKSKNGLVGSPIMVASVGGNDLSVSDPSVSMDSDGGFFVAWIALSQSPHGDVIEVRAFDNTGTALASAFTASDVAYVSDYHNLKIASRPDGSGAVFVFTVTGDIGLGGTEFGRVSTTALIGQVQGKPTHGIGDEIDPDVAVYPDGSFVKGRTLYVIGTNDADNIDVNFDGTNVIVTENGTQTFVIAYSKLMALTINGYGGNDTITNQTGISSTTGLLATINGGDGNDTLSG
jgi:hypothetical protein